MNEFDEQKYEERRRELWFALRTRPLTDAETKEAEGMGKYIATQMRVAYRIGEPERQLADAWAVQGVLRAAAMQVNSGSLSGANNSLYEIREMGT